MTATTQAASVPTATPPKWFNGMMETMLHTPGLQRWIGEAIALITVTGRKTGKSYTTPVTYYRDGDTVVIITKKSRKWWRNRRLASRIVATTPIDAYMKPEVELRLKGRAYRGRATARVGEEADLPFFVKFLENRRLDAKAYGVAFTPEGQVDREQARRVLSQVVLIRITLDGYDA